MTRAAFRGPVGSFICVCAALCAWLTVAASASAQTSDTAASSQPPATPVATAAPVAPPAPAATSGSNAAASPTVETGAETGATLSAAPAGANAGANATEPESELDWDLAHRRYTSWYGPTGGLFLFDGRASEPGAIRVQLGLDGFAADDYLRKGDHVELSNQTLALNVSATEWLEIYATLANRSAHQTKPKPARSLDTLGDISVGGRVGVPLGRLIDLGGDLRVTLTNQTGGGGFEWGATSLALRAALSIDLQRLEHPVPLLFRFNLGYVLDNSSVVVKDTENARYANLDNARSKADETRHLISRFERFALNINRLDRMVAGVGVELPLKVAKKFYLHPMLEWQMGLPVNRQGYDCPYAVGAADIGTNKSDEDSCYERDMSSLPMNLGFGVRVVPPVRGLSAVLGVDVGLMGTSHFVRDLAPNTPWRVLVALAYDYDARPEPVAAPAPVVAKVVQPPAPVVVAPITGRLQGTVATPDNHAIANARVGYVGLQLTDMITGADGHFVTEPMPPGLVTLEVTQPEYESAQCSATIPETGGDVPILCTLKPKPIVGRVEAEVVDNAGQAVAGARVIVSGPVNSIELTNASGKFVLDNLPPGRYDVRVEAGGYFIQLTSFTIEGRVTIPLSVPMRRKPIAPSISFSGDAIEAPTITYATDTAIQPLASSLPALAEIADLLLSRPDLYLQILGFGPTNEIGLARAQALKQKLVESGVPASHVETAGGGIHKLRLVLHR